MTHSTVHTDPRRIIPTIKLAQQLLELDVGCLITDEPLRFKQSVLVLKEFLTLLSLDRASPSHHNYSRHQTSLSAPHINIASLNTGNHDVLMALHRLTQRCLLSVSPEAQQWLVGQCSPTLSPRH